jgi:mannose-6-phosphate isomerase-like protein (cupin superfamily)
LELTYGIYPFVDSVKLFDDTNYSYSRKMFVPGYKNFKLHTHKAYEIYIFLKGNAEYVIESKIFPMKQYDNVRNAWMNYNKID